LKRLPNNSFVYQYLGIVQRRLDLWQEAEVNYKKALELDPRDVSGAVGRDMPHIVRTLRLMGLPPRARDLIATGRLTRAHAYALIDQPDPERAADQMLTEQSGVDEALRRIAAVPMGARQ